VTVGDSLQYTLFPGWNAVALPNYPAGIDSPGIADIFTDGARGVLVDVPAWGWHAAGDHLRPVPSPSVGQGFWVYSEAETQTQTLNLAGSFTVPYAPMETGVWNFTGVTQDVDLAQFLIEYPEFASTAMRWNPTDQHFEILPPTARLLRGEAYWFRQDP